MSDTIDKDPLDFIGTLENPLDNKEETIRKLQLIIRIRWFVSPFVFIILFIFSRFGLSYEREFNLFPVLMNTLVILLLNLLYNVLVKRLPDIKPLVYLQLFIDALHFTLTVYQTGGVTSPFVFLYYGVVIASAILVSGKVTILTAVMSGFFYSIIIILEYTGILPHNKIFIPLSGMESAEPYIVFSWIFNIASFFAIAFFASFLSSEIRRQNIHLKEANSILDKKIKIFAFLYKTSESLTNSDSMKKAVDYILDELLDFLKLDRALLYLVDDKKEALILYRTKHRDPADDEKDHINLTIPLRADAGLTAHTAISNQAINVDNPYNSPLINKELALKIGMNPFAMSPVSVNNDVLGVIGIDRSDVKGSISDEEFKILKIFANQAAIIIRYYKSMK